MDAKYKVGDMVIINLDNEIIDAEVFAYINLDLGRKSAYSLRIGNHFIFIEEEDIISVSNE